MCIYIYIYNVPNKLVSTFHVPNKLVYKFHVPNILVSTYCAKYIGIHMPNKLASTSRGKYIGVSLILPNQMVSTCCAKCIGVQLYMTLHLVCQIRWCFYLMINILVSTPLDKYICVFKS